MDDYRNRVEELIKQGESGAVEFKTVDVRPESLAREITAFSNTSGGTEQYSAFNKSRDKIDFLSGQTGALD